MSQGGYGPTRTDDCGNLSCLCVLRLGVMTAATLGRDHMYGPANGPVGLWVGEADGPW